ncbi:MAG: hypothetical protein L0216_07340 [Planctomycetales bacterium]|nr:hypothetical protein [Planctomycetales bacterium]
MGGARGPAGLLVCVGVLAGGAAVVAAITLLGGRGPAPDLAPGAGDGGAARAAAPDGEAIESLGRAISALDARLARIETLLEAAAPRLASGPPAPAARGAPESPAAPATSTAREAAAPESLVRAVRDLADRVTAFDARLEEIAKAHPLPWTLLGVAGPDVPFSETVLQDLRRAYEEIERKWMTDWQASIDAAVAERASAGSSSALDAKVAAKQAGLQQCHDERAALPGLRTWLDFARWCRWSGADPPDVILGLRPKGG